MTIRILRRIVTGQIVVCVLLVVWMVFAGFYFDRETVAMRSLSRLAKDYYENYFYDNFVTEGVGGFESYAEIGFPNVSLRQLLSFDGARNADYVKDFYGCDKERTVVKITPLKPFKRVDYVIETALDCG